MEMNDYQNQAMRFNDGLANQRLIKRVSEMTIQEEAVVHVGDLFEALIGLNEEMGEISKNINQWVFREKKLNEDNLAEEIGDLIWYIAELCNSFGWDMEEIVKLNLEKLEKRYPEGFRVGGNI